MQTPRQVVQRSAISGQPQNKNSNSSASINTLTFFVNINNHPGETNMHRMAESQQLQDVPRESAGIPCARSNSKAKQQSKGK